MADWPGSPTVGCPPRPSSSRYSRNGDGPTRTGAVGAEGACSGQSWANGVSIPPDNSAARLLARTAARRKIVSIGPRCVFCAPGKTRAVFLCDESGQRNDGTCQTSAPMEFGLTRRREMRPSSPLPQTHPVVDVCIRCLIPGGFRAARWIRKSRSFSSPNTSATKLRSARSGPRVRTRRNLVAADSSCTDKRPASSSGEDGWGQQRRLARRASIQQAFSVTPW